MDYGKLQILEVFKNTLPPRLYWVLFPIEDLRQAVETSKRLLTKEKIDRQLAGQSTSTPFMSIKDNYVNKRVTFDTKDGLQEKIGRLTTMMSVLTAHDDEQSKLFKPKIYQSKRREQMRNFDDKHNYDQRNYQNRYRSGSRDRRISFSGRIQCGSDYIDKLRYEQNYRDDFRRDNFGGNVKSNQTYRGQNYRGGYRRNCKMKIMKEVGIYLEKGSIQVILEGMTEVAVADLHLVQELVQIETRSDAVSVQNMITSPKTV